jgi:hypothetical protein
MPLYPQNLLQTLNFRQQIFVRNVGWLLSATGLAKLVGFFGHAPVLGLREPIMQIPFRELFLVAGMVELAVAVFCLTTKRLNLSMAIIAWLSAVFLAYRASLTWVGWKMPCPCLGNFVEILHVPPMIANLIMKIVIIYMLVGSYSHLLRHWLTDRNGIKPADVKSML